VEALFVGATTAGGREAAGAAAEWLKAKLEEASRRELSLTDAGLQRVALGQCVQLRSRRHFLGRLVHEDGVVGEGEIKPIAVVEKTMQPRDWHAFWRP
jgi:hypothetical protein